jgi:CheY-like chemotaxis protein
MGEVIRLQGLLFSSDAQVLSVMNQVLDNFEIETEVCIEPASALGAVTSMKLDTLIMDWMVGEECAQILSAMRSSEQNSKSTVLAMVNGDPEMQAATRAGANFIVYKPITVDQATRFLRASYGNMLLQRRRAARCPVDIPVTANIVGGGAVEGKIIDLSVRGLAFRCSHEIQIDQQLTMVFRLPGTTWPVHVTGRVVNVISPDSHIRVGICFSSVPPSEHTVLEQWLADHLPKLPEVPLKDHHKTAN